MKVVIDISKDIMDKLSGSLNLSPFYDNDNRESEVDGDALSYAIKLMVELCAD